MRVKLCGPYGPDHVMLNILGEEIYLKLWKCRWTDRDSHIIIAVREDSLHMILLDNSDVRWFQGNGQQKNRWMIGLKMEIAVVVAREGEWTLLH